MERSQRTTNISQVKKEKKKRKNHKIKSAQIKTLGPKRYGSLQHLRKAEEMNHRTYASIQL